jgi:hypothetical protein
MNLNQPLDFHIKNTKNNNIEMSKPKIRKILYLLREEKNPKEDFFLLK